jgi:hypothetical protein
MPLLAFPSLSSVLHDSTSSHITQQELKLAQPLSMRDLIATPSAIGKEACSYVCSWPGLAELTSLGLLLADDANKLERSLTSLFHHPLWQTF